MRVWSFPDNFNEHHFNGLKSQKNFTIELRIKAMVRGHIPIRSFVLIQIIELIQIEFSEYNLVWLVVTALSYTRMQKTEFFFLATKNVFRKFNS